MLSANIHTLYIHWCWLIIMNVKIKMYLKPYNRVANVRKNLENKEMLEHLVYLIKPGNFRRHVLFFSGNIKKLLEYIFNFFKYIQKRDKEILNTLHIVGLMF